MQRKTLDKPAEQKNFVKGGLKKTYMKSSSQTVRLQGSNITRSGP